ncbi:MAG TPA: malectin domain-containing carbohydrate-binding protein, partial [Bacteroidales bacterium]|nr:malectin domain-containing carbohydrate-binding protein [Bacteroidales bacterium]
MKKLVLLLLLFVGFSGSSLLRAQNMQTVYPREYPDGLRNPLKGFRPDLNSAGDSNYPYPTIVRDYIRWNQIENDASDGVQKIIDFCNERWKGLEEMNVKVIPRVYIDWDSSNGNEYWPSDLTPGDWSSQEFKDRVVKLIYKLGEAWDYDPRVAWVQTGIIGYWGEQENPVGVDEDGWAKRLGEAYDAAFNNKKLVVRNQGPWDENGFEWGVYWDSFGHPGQKNGAWKSIQETNARGRYLNQIVEGEVAYNWGNDIFDPLYGSTPTITLGIDEYTMNMIDVIRELHCTGLGWIAGYKLDGRDGTDPDKVRANASIMQKAFGYRFVLPEFSCSSRANQGEIMDINFKVKNVGSAPFYENWPLAFVLINETTEEIVWKQDLLSVDIRNWRPGSNYSYSTGTYQNPAEEYVVDTTVTIPNDIPIGQYMAGLTILEPYSQTPGIFFAVKNFLASSQTQPLCRVGIGEDLTGDPNIDTTIFDDPVADNNRSYTLTPQGKTFSISTDSPNGSIIFKPSGGSYLPGTIVTVTAMGDVGYGFDSWGGDLSGSENSITLTMDSDKTVSATFKKVPTHNLIINPNYGSVILDPPGGVYNEGKVVTLTPVPEFGYNFGEWSGDLSGSKAPATITMDSDKYVTANFFFAGGGTLESAINCGGSKYNSADGGVYSADINYVGGSLYTTDAAISGTLDDALYQSERFGSDFSYKIPLENGNYDVTLMFAEIFFDQPGNRIFNVSIKGTQVLSNFDICAKVGKNKADNETFPVTINDGELNIVFTTIKDNAKISAIKISSKFTGETYSLTTNETNGIIDFDPADAPYPAGSNVLLTAIPDAGFKFSEWSGDLTGTENPATIYMDANKNVTATFVEVPTYNLTTNTSNGTIMLDPAGAIYEEGTVVTIAAIPDKRYQFAGWGDDLSGSNNPENIIMDSD